MELFISNEIVILIKIIVLYFVFLIWYLFSENISMKSLIFLTVWIFTNFHRFPFYLTKTKRSLTTNPVWNTPFKQTFKSNFYFKFISKSPNRKFNIYPSSNSNPTEFICMLGYNSPILPLKLSLMLLYAIPNHPEPRG